MQRYGQKTSKMPPKWKFSPICDPSKFFFTNRALSLLYPYGALTSCKKLEKSLERSLRYLKTDGPRTDGRTRAITKDPLGRTRGKKKNKLHTFFAKNCKNYFVPLQKMYKFVEKYFLTLHIPLHPYIRNQKWSVPNYQKTNLHVRPVWGPKYIIPWYNNQPLLNAGVNLRGFSVISRWVSYILAWTFFNFKSYQVLLVAILKWFWQVLLFFLKQRSKCLTITF